MTTMTNEWSNPQQRDAEDTEGQGRVFRPEEARDTEGLDPSWSSRDDVASDVEGQGSSWVGPDDAANDVEGQGANWRRPDDTDNDVEGQSFRF
jgi:hypothetical protein